MATKFTSTRDSFNRKHRAFVSMSQQRMAMNVEVVIKTGGETPVDTGNMKSQVRHFATTNHSFRTEADANYSAVQEAGARDGKSFRNYTTAGTGPHWFQHAIDKTLAIRSEIVHESAVAVGLA